MAHNSEVSIWKCRDCEACRKARDLSWKRRKLRTKGGLVPDRVPTGPTVETLVAWRAEGFSDTVLASATGLDRGAIVKLRNGKVGLIHRDREATVLELQRAELLAQPAGVVPPVGARRRLQALACLGWGPSTLNVGYKDWQRIVEQPPRRRQGPRLLGITTVMQQKIVRLFDEHAMTRGPSEYWAAQAKAKGWAPPLAWDEGDMDNPDAKPIGKVKYEGGFQGYRAHQTDMFLSDFDILYGTTSPDLVAEALGMTPTGVQAALRKAGRIRQAREYEPLNGAARRAREARQKESA